VKVKESPMKMVKPWRDRVRVKSQRREERKGKESTRGTRERRRLTFIRIWRSLGYEEEVISY